MMNTTRALKTNNLNSRQREGGTWYPCTQMQRLEDAPPIAIQRASGVWLYDQEGNRYLDGISSWWVNLFGHNHPKINAAIQQQLKNFSHIMLAGLTHEPVMELSARLTAVAPSGLSHCFYASDGASAVEIALKMSHHYWRNLDKPGKSTFISLANGYHGETLGSLSVTDVALFKEAYAPLLFESMRLPSPDWRNAASKETARDFAIRCIATLESHLRDNSENVAAFILEPLVQGAAGMAMYHPEYLSHARQICDRYQIHLIADEIAVAFGRTGTMFACEQANIAPDFMCLSKGLSGGYLPLSVVIATNDIYEAFYDGDIKRGFLHSHSYTGNALACSAALAVLDIFADEQVLAANKQKSAHLNKLVATFVGHPQIKNFRNTGMIWAFDIKGVDQHFAQNFHRHALKNGLLLRPIGNTVYWMPPYVISSEEMEFLVENTFKTLEQTLKHCHSERAFSPRT